MRDPSDLSRALRELQMQFPRVRQPRVAPPAASRIRHCKHPGYGASRHTTGAGRPARGCENIPVALPAGIMFSLEIECDPDDRDLLIAELWEHGSAGIVELNAQRLRAGFRIEEQRDWVQSAHDLLQPMEVGAKFFLVPAWRDDPAPPGRFRILVNPGLAFGTGVHETTRLCIEALEEYRKPGMAVLDVGTGSGIL